MDQGRGRISVLTKCTYDTIIELDDQSMMWATFKEMDFVLGAANDIHGGHCRHISHAVHLCIYHSIFHRLHPFCITIVLCPSLLVLHHPHFVSINFGLTMPLFCIHSSWLEILPSWLSTFQHRVSLPSLLNCNLTDSRAL